MKIPVLIEKHKHIFGTYSAMALMNIRTVLNHIQKITGIVGEMPQKNGKETEDYWEHPVVLYLKDISKTNSQREKLETLTEKMLCCLPFLKVMANNQREYSNKVNNENRLEINGQDIYSVLNTILRVLKKYRDYCCHYYMEDNCWDDNSIFLKNEHRLSIIINNYYTVALRNTKERYKYNTEQLAFIQDHRYTRKKVNYEFFLSIQNPNDDRTQKPHLSGVGVAQLIALFLEKKYINSFIAQAHLCERYAADSEEYKIIRRSMGISSIVMPKERLHPDKKGVATALDMLNELKRCPKELFETLSYQDQALFRMYSSDHNEVLFMRSKDRFAQLALQYIDNNHLFDSIRFHVNMGKLRYLFSPDKLCIDNERRVRVIEHPINAYGRLNEIEEYRKSDKGTFADSNITIRDFESIQRDDADSSNYPYIVDTYTNYIIRNNKVEFCFCNNNIIPKIEQVNGKWYVNKTIPHCRMSTLELPAMMFHLHLLGEERTEARIKEVYENYKSLFNALANGTLNKENIDSYGIAKEDMPQKVLDAVNGVTKGKSYNAYAMEVLAGMLAETNKLKERLKADKKTVNSQDNKMGKHGYRQISAGKLADFLAKDIVKFQPTLKSDEEYGTDRLTGLNYRVMQASIATFSTYIDADALTNLKQLFQKAGLIGGDSRRNHPFLQRVLSRNPRNTVELYENYLFARAKFIEELIGKSKDERSMELPFINRDRNKWIARDEGFYRTMGDIYLEDIAIELPRQMFDNDIKQALKKLPQMNDVDFDNANTTYLIGEYVKRVLNDEFQSFYQLKRNYRYIDLLKGICDSRNNICKQYTSTEDREDLWKEREERKASYIQWAQKKRRNDIKLSRMSDKEFYEMTERRLSNSRNDYQKSEKVIRRYKVQDALLFIMVGDTLKRHLEFKAEDFKLKDIMPDTDRGILSEIMPIDFTFEKNGNRYTIHSDGIKLKNYGDFFSLANDKRIESLFRIVSSDYINKDEMEQELDNYDTSRPRIVKLVFDLEKWAFNKYPEMKNKVTGESHFDFAAILKELIEREELNSDETRILSQIRNAFNHNIYPNKGIVEIDTLPEIAKHLIDIFGRYAHMRTE